MAMERESVSMFMGRHQMSKNCLLPRSCADAQGWLSCHKTPERNWSRCHILSLLTRHIPHQWKHSPPGQLHHPSPTTSLPWNPWAPPVPGLSRPVKKTTTLQNPKRLQANSTSKYPWVLSSQLCVPRHLHACVNMRGGPEEGHGYAS